MSEETRGLHGVTQHPHPDGNGWDKWKNHVLSEVEDNKEDHKAIFAKLDEIHADIVGLKIKNKWLGSVYGLLGGAFPVIILLGIWAIKG